MRNPTLHANAPFVPARRSAEPMRHRHELPDPPKPGLQAVAWRRAIKVVVGRTH